jgi:hypothetical protein
MSAVLAEASYHKELIDGREVEKPLPKNLHAFIQTFLGRSYWQGYRETTEQPQSSTLCADQTG